MTYTTASLVEAELVASTSFSTSTTPTLAQVETWIGETDSYIEQLAGKSYASTQYTELIDYDGEETIYLSRGPIISIDTFNYSAEPLGSDSYPDWTAKTEDTHFYVNEKGEIKLIFKQFRPLPGDQRMSITYTAGSATTPGYVQMLATKLVAKRVIDTILQKDVKDKESGKSISVGSINIVKPSSFGVNQYSQIKSDIEMLKNELLRGEGVYKYTNY